MTFISSLPIRFKIFTYQPRNWVRKTIDQYLMRHTKHRYRGSTDVWVWPIVGVHLRRFYYWRKFRKYSNYQDILNNL